MTRFHKIRLAAFSLLLPLVACGTTPSTPTAAPSPTAIPPTATTVSAVTTSATATSSAPTLVTATAPLATPTPSATAPRTPAVTAKPATPSAAPLAATRTMFPGRTPDMTTGTPSDGWILDKIETAESAGRVTFTLRFQPLPGKTGGPQAEAWFESSDNTYSIVVRGVRGSNAVLRPGEVTPLNAPPLRGYYPLVVRDDTIFALVVVAARPSTSWSLAGNDTPGVLRLTVER